MKVVCLCLVLVSVVGVTQAGPADFFGNLINRVRGQVEAQIGDLNKSLQELVLSNFDDSALTRAVECFESELNGQQFNFGNRSESFTGMAAKYFSLFPAKLSDANFPSRLRNLLTSVLDIVSRCADPAKNDTAKFGFTELSDRSAAEVRALFGVQVPDEAASSSRRKRLSGSDSACQVSGSVAASFDWRSQGIVTSVKNQGSCGSCWSFATTGSVESALVKARRAAVSVDLSEQQLVNCVYSNGCNGGNSQTAFSYVKSKGQVAEASNPYQARAATCSSSLPVAATIRDFCVRSKFRYTSASLAESLSDATIQQALVANGPLYITVDANPLQNYRSGVLSSSSCTTNINHAVLLVGYSGPNNSWIVKNSWGTSWGQQGYFEVVRGKNMCGINTEIAWPLL